MKLCLSEFSSRKYDYIEILKLFDGVIFIFKKYFSNEEMLKWLLPENWFNRWFCSLVPEADFNS